MSVTRLPDDFALIKVPGNGDCFYHAVMMNIIHGALSETIEENSPTANVIKEHVLPAILANLQTKGAAMPDFTGTLKNSILALLKTASDTDYPSPSREIEECDFWHLLRDICGPALRSVMLAGTHNNPAYKHSVKEILKLEFHARVKSLYGKQLGLRPDEITAAQQQICEDLPAAILNSWAAWQRVHPHITNLDTLFETWWATDHQRAVQAYTSIHATSGIMAGKPQHIALAKQLRANFCLRDQGSQNISPMTVEMMKPDANSFYFSKKPNDSHYDAFVPFTSNKNDIGNALRKRATYCYDHSAELNANPYPWRQKQHGSSVFQQCAWVHESLKTEFSAIHNQIKTLDLTTLSLNHSSKEYLRLFKSKGYQYDARSPGSLPTDTRKLQQEQDDLQLAIQLQNEEIRRFFSGK